METPVSNWDQVKESNDPDAYVNYLVANPKSDYILEVLDSCKEYWRKGDHASSLLPLNHRNVISIAINPEKQILLKGKIFPLEELKVQMANLYFHQEGKKYFPEQNNNQKDTISAALFMVEGEIFSKNLARSLFVEISHGFDTIKQWQSHKLFDKDFEDLTSSELQQLEKQTPLPLIFGLPKMISYPPIPEKK